MEGDGFDCDYIVVGSGAGGGTVAARLAEKGMSVILLEAGCDPRSAGSGLPADYDIPAFHPFASENEAMAWNYWVDHYSDEGRAKRDWRRREQGILYPRAGTLGGCTAHNAMIFIVPQDRDWNAIAEAAGDEGWSAEAMRPYQRRVEACRHRKLRRFLSRLGIDGTGHGWDGWLPVELAMPLQGLADRPMRHMLQIAAFAASRQISTWRGAVERLFRGWLDPNDRRMNGCEGLCYAPLATDGHRRVGTRERVLGVAGDHPLRIETEALATRILFGTGGRAEGIEYLKGPWLYRASPKAQDGSRGVRATLRARREVILAAGAFNTPQLLMLSGIGPREQLALHEIPERVPLRGVGRNLQDRYEVCVLSKLRKPWRSLRGARFTADDPLARQWGRKKRRGMYISNGAALAVKRSSKGDPKDADLFIMALLGCFNGYFPGYSEGLRAHHDVLSWAILKARTANRSGTVSLRSADPCHPPAICFNSFDESVGDADLEAVAKAVEMVRRTAAPLRSLGIVEREICPGEHVTGEALKKWIRDNAWGHHASCTCPMGAVEEGGVLDSRLRVHGVEGLRVVDASIFPRIPGYFIVSAVYMAAEKAADMIIEDAECAQTKMEEAA